MKRQKFIKAIDEIEKELRGDFDGFGATGGFCYYIQSHISWQTMKSFKKEFRKDSPFPNSAYWLGDMFRESSYKTRLEYLQKFKAHGLKRFRYLFY